MTLEQWAYIGEIAAAAAVIASLLYLGIQVRQSNALSRAQTSQSMIQMARQEILSVVEPPEIWSAFTKDEISNQEKIKLNQWLISSMRQREYEWLANKSGVIDSAMYEAYTAVIPVILGTERTRGWWKFHRQTLQWAPGFLPFVDELLADSPLTDFFDSLDKWG